MADAKQQAAEIEALANMAETEDFKPDAADLAAPEASAPPRVDVGVMVGTLVGVGFGILADRRGDHWKLADDEASALGGAIGDVIEAYCPNISAGPLPVLGGVSLMVIGPRLMIDQQLAAKAGEKEQGGGADGDKREHAA